MRRADGIRRAAGRAGDAGPKTLLPSWEPSATLKAGLGYKDNVGLSRTAPEASPFVHTAVEGMLLRLPVDGTQVLLYLAGGHALLGIEPTRPRRLCDDPAGGPALLGK
ncbi:MAG: hypothetical protein IPK15_10780 [Verrucomicrobia bacterium]|nr:hypothetical protein [Verrucomicrobiota bacterium]